MEKQGTRKKKRNEQKKNLKFVSERTANIAVMVVGVDEMAQKQSTNKNQIWFEKKKKN